MFKNKTSSKEIDAAVARSVDFELTIVDLARRSERRAWAVAFSAVALALIMAGAIFYMLPLKQKVPFLVMADAATGVATVAHLTDDANVQRITSSEAINRSNVAHFVQARESYDSAFLNLHDWNTVLTMASPGVAAAYTSLYSPQNPDNPYQTYGRDRAIRINILSIVLGGGAGKAPKGATVRFQRSIYNKQTGGTMPLDNKIAMMEFTYRPDLRMDERARLENPLGFQVTAYQVDSDFSSPAPAAVPVAPQPVVPAPPPVAEPPASAAAPPTARSRRRPHHTAHKAKP
jgi:type IV secretion system protein VirB8